MELLIRDAESFANLKFFLYRTNIFLGYKCPPKTDYTLLSQVEVFIHYLVCRNDLGLQEHMNFCPAECKAHGDRKAGSFRQTGELNTVLRHK